MTTKKLIDYFNLTNVPIWISDWSYKIDKKTIV
jgi:hypothetical protein